MATIQQQYAYSAADTAAYAQRVAEAATRVEKLAAEETDYNATNIVKLTERVALLEREIRRVNDQCRIATEALLQLRSHSRK
jgi:chromosome segregation ATPase